MKFLEQPQQGLVNERALQEFDRRNAMRDLEKMLATTSVRLDARRIRLPSDARFAILLSKRSLKYAAAKAAATVFLTGLK
jgi:hypothetical protein